MAKNCYFCYRQLEMINLNSKNQTKNMRKILIFTFIVFSNFVFGQNNSIDFLDQIKKYDVSNFWTTRTLENNDTIGQLEPFGYIGNNFQRFYIHFISVIQNPNNRLEYFVYGKTKVKDNICTFQGSMKIDSAKMGTNISKNNGAIKGHFDFFEDPDMEGTGVLNGEFYSEFYIDKKDKLNFFGEPGYPNNEFEGTWKSYNTGLSKKCNWGDYRIPDSKELDGGASEFGPALKYADYGWKNFQIAWWSNSNFDKEKVEQARKIEREKWWIDIEKD